MRRVCGVMEAEAVGEGEEGELVKPPKSSGFQIAARSLIYLGTGLK